MTTRRCSDSDLAEFAAAAKAGDAAALDQIYRCCHADVLGFFRRKLPDEAEDLTQEVFASVSKALDNYFEQGRFRAWLLGIALNRLRLALRRPDKAGRPGGPKRVQVTLSSGLQSPQTDTSTLFATRKQELRELVPRLPSAERRAWELHVQQHSNQEIASKLGTSAAAIHTRLSRARARLAQWLIAHDGPQSE